MVLSLAHMLPSTSDKNLILSMLVHTVILSASELNQRLCVGTMRQSTTFLDNFAHAALHILEWLSQNEALTERHWDLHDLVDGRLFHAVASCSVDELDLSAAVLGRVMLLAQCVGGDLCTDALTIANGSSPDDTLLCLPKKTVDKMSTSVLPFSQPIFDRHLAAVRIETASSEAPTPARSAIVFQELTHWHNQRPLETEKIQQPQTSWHLKRHQWHMRDMTAYAASLASPSGKAISPEVIIAGQTSSKAPIKIQNRNIQRSHKQIQQKTGGRAAALESARRISERKSMAHESVISNHWNTTMRNLLDEETDLIDRYLKGSKYLAGLSTDALGVIGSDIHLYLCDVLVSLVQKKKFAGAKQPYRGKSDS